jgi:hypothetical protein
MLACNKDSALEEPVLSILSAGDRSTMFRVLTLIISFRVPTLPMFHGDLWQGVKNGLFDPYRPERHYMRGPGPKWREKYGLFLPEVNTAGRLVIYENNIMPNLTR